MFFSPQITGLKKKWNYTQACLHTCLLSLSPFAVYCLLFYMRTFQFGRRNPREGKKRKLLTLPNLMIKIKTDQPCFCNTVLTCELVLRYWPNEYQFPNVQWVFISGQLVVKLFFSFFSKYLECQEVHTLRQNWK